MLQSPALLPVRRGGPGVRRIERRTALASPSPGCSRLRREHHHGHRGHGEFPLAGGAAKAAQDFDDDYGHVLGATLGRFASTIFFGLRIEMTTDIPSTKTITPSDTSVSIFQAVWASSIFTPTNVSTAPKPILR